MFSRRSWRDSETLAIDAVDALPPRRGMTPDARRDEAISRGLAKRLEQLAAERERRERAAEKADAEFSNEFLNAARKCFEMIDDDQSGTLEKAEIVLPGVLLIINPAHSLIDLRTGDRCPVEPKSDKIPDQLRQ